MIKNLSHQQLLQRLFLLSLAFLLTMVVAHLAWQTALRVTFPWDLYIWSESPFLTNLLKIKAGASIYTSPADANSFVYAPGLEWLALVLLEPFGLALDIRYMRVLIILFGLAACLIGARLMTSAAPLPDGKDTTGNAIWFAFAALILVLFNNVTADTVHPDSLHLFHAIVTFMLGWRAINSGSYRVAIVAMCWAGVGVFTKQTEAVSFLALGIAFYVLGAWSKPQKQVLLAIGAIATGCSVALLWAPEYAKLYTFDVLMGHSTATWKIYMLIVDVLYYPHRLFLLILLGPSIYWLYHRSPSAKSYIVLWGATAVFCCGPNLPAYFKEMGMPNNLGIIDFWMMLAVWPVIYSLSVASPRELSFVPQSLARVGMLLIPLILITNHVPPSSQYYAFASDLESRLIRDKAAGCSVLVDNNTSALIRAGYTDIPLDRINSFNNLKAAGMEGLTATQDRIIQGHYDRIYTVWREPSWQAALETSYVRVGVIPGSPLTGLSAGYMGMLKNGAEIWERQDDGLPCGSLDE